MEEGSDGEQAARVLTWTLSYAALTNKDKLYIQAD